MLLKLKSPFFICIVLFLFTACESADHLCTRNRVLTKLNTLPDSMKGNFIMDSANYVIEHGMENPLVYALSDQEFIRKGRTDNPIFAGTPATAIWSFTKGIESGFFLKTTPAYGPTPEFWELSKVTIESAKGKKYTAWIFSSYKDSLTCNHYLIGTFQKR